VVFHFKIVDNGDGSGTYFVAADDIHRGIDVVRWTGPPNSVGAAAPQRPRAARPRTSDCLRRPHCCCRARPYSDTGAGGATASGLL
jgi:hypothetical protein